MWGCLHLPVFIVNRILNKFMKKKKTAHVECSLVVVCNNEKIWPNVRSLI